MKRPKLRIEEVCFVTMMIVRPQRQKRKRGAPFRRSKKRIVRVRTARRQTALASSLGVEIKFVDHNLASASLTNPSDVTGGLHNPSATIPLNGIAIGDTEQSRDGRRVNMKSITVHGAIHMPEVNNFTDAPFPIIQAKIWLVLDRQANGAVLANGNVFKNENATAFTALSVFRNLQFKDRFTILAGTTVSMSPAATGASDQGANSQVFSLSANLKDLPVSFSGTTNTITSITDNSVSLIAWASNISAPAPLLSYNSRLRFVG